MGQPIKTIEVTVQGFPPVTASHVTAAAAFADVWRKYQVYDDRCTFRRFMEIATRRVVPNPPGVGDPINVCGRPAWSLEPPAHTRAFVYDGERVPMRAHHSEIEDARLRHSKDT
ncbi:MAG: hypothetical protein CMN10_07030 [Roseobacter sp.]|nr:hypothetical protein [Roseobacter sp.]MBV48300.1 hypothetical protein [Roseobacter sp.]|tara:strand:+ start:26214 stop:26555 length:342 start_codon:yes stop_codon:yes gene_type:complete